MLKAQKGLAPVTREERQAAATVQSAKTVVVEIEALRKLLTDEATEKSVRKQAKRDLLEASDRLCNLMALAVYQLTNGVNSEFQGRLKAALDELRGRLLDMGTNLMLEKLEKIHDRAETVLAGGAYPLGLANRLDRAYSAIVGNLHTLGALDRLEDKSRTLVEGTGREIKNLAAVEAKLGVLSDME